MNPLVIGLIFNVATAAAKAVAERLGHPNPEAVAREVAEGVTAVSPKPVHQAAKEVTKAIETMPAAKPWYTSTGIWGGLLTAAIGILTMAGIQADWIDPQRDTETLIALATAIAGIVAAVGRWRATRQVG